MSTPTKVTRRFKVNTEMLDADTSVTVMATVQLEVDMASLVRQLTAAALVADSKPKRVTRVHDAVSLVILEEQTLEL